MKYALNYLIAFALAFNNFVSSYAFGAEKRNIKQVDVRLESLHKLREKVGPSLGFGQFVNALENHFNTSTRFSVARYVSKENQKMPVSFFVYKNKVRVDAGGKSAIFEVLGEETLLLNGVQLFKEDFASTNVLMDKIQKVMKVRGNANKYSLLNMILDNLIPHAQADFNGGDIAIAAIGGIAFALAAWFIGKGIGKIGKGIGDVGKNTNHNIKLDVPNTTQTINANVAGGTTHTAKLDVGGTVTANGNGSFDLGNNAASTLTSIFGQQ
jgi:hypothetical protein